MLDWAGGADATVTPFGGGSSVCGGVEPQRGSAQGRGDDRPARAWARCKEVDKTSRAALIEGGTYRPGARSAAAPARADAAPFSAELRIFDARRLDRDARRRPFRDALHPHRRFRRIAAHRHAAGRDRDAAACPAPARARAPTA